MQLQKLGPPTRGRMQGEMKLKLPHLLAQYDKRAEWKATLLTTDSFL
jgi:hypothetical protein